MMYGALRSHDSTAATDRADGPAILAAAVRKSPDRRGLGIRWIPSAIPALPHCSGVARPVRGAPPPAHVFDSATAPSTSQSTCCTGQHSQFTQFSRFSQFSQSVQSVRSVLGCAVRCTAYTRVLDVPHKSQRSPSRNVSVHPNPPPSLALPASCQQGTSARFKVARRCRQSTASRSWLAATPSLTQANHLPLVLAVAAPNCAALDDLWMTSGRHR